MKRMKKTLALLLSLSLLLGVCAVGSLTAFADPSICEVVVYEEDFESEPTGWTFVDVDGDGFCWYYYSNAHSSATIFPRSGDGILISESFHWDTRVPLNPDNWAFTPPMAIPWEATLSFWVCQQDNSWTYPLVEKFEVYAFAVDDPAAPALPTGDYTTVMTKIAEGQTEGQQQYTEVTADLSAFAGQTIYLAIRHFNTYDNFFLNVDDMVVKGYNHSYGTEGDEFYTCSICGEENETRKILALAVPVSAQDPTCTEDGNIACYTYDGKYYQINEETGSVIELTLEDVTIPALNHPETETIITPATCTESGSEDEICKLCGETLEQTPIPATGNHTWEWVTDTAPTCGADGVKHEECTVCHTKQNENTPISATGNHTWEWITDTEPTCGADGVKHEECSVCHAVQNENTPIPATGNHTWEWITDTEPTCGADGVKHEECSVCHAVQNENTPIPATENHTWEWITDTEPTCSADGVKHEECSVCHAVQSENTPIPATGNHDWKNAWSKDGDNHWHDCTRCDEKNDEAAHTYGEVTYTWEQTGGAWKATAKHACTVCEWEESETVNATGAQSKAPTCSVNGETTYTAVFDNPAFETKTQTVADIDALNHDWKTEWSKDGDMHWHDCTRCDEKNDEAAHTYGEVSYTWEQTGGAWKATAKHACTVCEWEETETVTATGAQSKAPACTVNGETTYTATFTNPAFETQTKTVDDIAALDHAYDAVITEPTCTEDGYTTHTCSRCGDSYTDSETEALGHAWGEWEIVRIAAPGEKGEKKRVCTRCGEVETAEIDELMITSSVDGQTGSSLVVTVPYAKRGAIATTLTADEPVTYTSSDPKLLVRFVRLCIFCKSATITAVSADGSKVATCKVNIEIKWWQYIVWFFLGSLWF